MKSVNHRLVAKAMAFQLVLRSLSCSKSAFGTFMFSKSFFSEYDILRLDPDAYNVCRIPMKVSILFFLNK